MIQFIGLIMGLLTLFLPRLFWPHNGPKLSSQDFLQQYPGKRRLYYFHFVLPIAWIALYVVIIVPLLWTIGDEQLYLVSFTLGGGLAIVHGIVEILTNVSMRNFSKGGPATYFVDHSVRQLGWIRVGLVFLSGLVSLGMISLFAA